MAYIINSEMKIQIDNWLSLWPFAVAMYAVNDGDNVSYFKIYL